MGHSYLLAIVTDWHMTEANVSQSTDGVAACVS